MKKIGFIGLGSMGAMLLKSFLKASMFKDEDTFIFTLEESVLDNFRKDFPKINICKDNEEVASKSDCLFLCVRPFDSIEVLKNIKSSLKKETHIITVVSCVTFAHYASIVDAKITKVIPSATLEIQKGVSLMCHNDLVLEEEKAFAEKLFSVLGMVKLIKENDFELSTDLTSCAPGLISAIFGEFINACARHDSALSKDDMQEMVLETLLATAKLLTEKKISFDDLIKRVATKGGITQEGVSVLQEKMPAVFDQVLDKTLSKHDVIKSKIDELI